MPLSAGDKLGPYEIISPIGKGGMGEVWKARDPRLNRDVAIKVSTQQFSERFEREAHAIGALNHPNICQVYDIGPNYLVMEFIQGAPLAGPLPLDVAWRHAVQIAEALSAAHAKGITHRDLKPANILVTASGIKLLDFGLALVTRAGDGSKGSTDATATIGMTQAGTIVGTAAYMSPEQAEAKLVDARSDVFSFGLVLYEMLSGRRAFTGDSIITIMAAIVRDEPEPLDAPPAVQSIVTRCLRKSPAARFQTMSEVRTALEQVRTVPTEATPSIAVLPFANMSRDADNEYFSDGLAEEILNQLAKIPGLKVIARTSAFAFKGQNIDIRKIADALGVRTLLEGSVRRAGNRVRITAQLIEAQDGSHLWSERYDREMADVFALQDDIAAAIAAALRMKLSVKPAARREHTPQLAAYEALLRARHHLNKSTPKSMELALECLRQAIELDSGYALAHNELGNYFNRLAVYNMLPAHEAIPLARASVQRALDIDPSLPDALATLGWITAHYYYDWMEAERLFLLAMANAPVPPRVRQLYGSTLIATGRLREAMGELEHALREDPLNLSFLQTLNICFYLEGREADALEGCRRILEINENSYLAYTQLSYLYARQGKLEEAVRAAEKVLSLAPSYLPNIGALAGLLVRVGNSVRAATMVQKLGDGTDYGAAFGLVVYFLFCGEIDKAADWVEKAIEQRQPIVGSLRTPLAQDLRASSRWPALAKMMNLPHAK